MRVIGGWDLDALRECAAHRPVIHAGEGQRVRDQFTREDFALLHRGLARPWEECEVLELRYRWCPTCSTFTVYEYFSDGPKLWTICWDCGWLMSVFMRTQVAELSNRIHDPERILYTTPEMAALTQERLISIG